MQLFWKCLYLWCRLTSLSINQFQMIFLPIAGRDKTEKQTFSFLVWSWTPKFPKTLVSLSYLSLYVQIFPDLESKTYQILIQAFEIFGQTSWESCARWPDVFTSAAFTPDTFTQISSHPDSFTHGHFLTQTVSHADSFTQGLLHTGHLHMDIFTQIKNWRT